MTLDEFITRIVDDGIAEVTAVYSDPSRHKKRDGAIAGFEACRGASVDMLMEVAKEATQARIKAATDNREDYWWFRHFEEQVLWVMKCVSVVLENQQLPVLIKPNSQAYFKAARILNSF